VIDLTLNVFIIFLFCSNIIKMTIQSKEAMSAVNVVNPGISWHNSHSPIIFKMMIKLFVLSCFTVASTVLYTVSELTLLVSIGMAGYTGDYTFYRIISCIYFILCNVDALMSTLFVLLSFAFARKWYNKLCSCLDAKCFKIWTKSLASRGHLIKSMMLSNRNGISVPGVTPGVTPGETNDDDQLSSPLSTNGVDLEVSVNVNSEGHSTGNDGRNSNHEEQRSDTVKLDELLQRVSCNIIEILGEEFEDPVSKEEAIQF